MTGWSQQTSDLRCESGNSPTPFDGLKRALKKELESNGYGIVNMFTMNVYPPGETKGAVAYGPGSFIGDIGMQLDAAPLKAPYHVEVS